MFFRCMRKLRTWTLMLPLDTKATKHAINLLKLFHTQLSWLEPDILSKCNNSTVDQCRRAFLLPSSCTACLWADMWAVWALMWLSGAWSIMSALGSPDPTTEQEGRCASLIQRVLWSLERCPCGTRDGAALVSVFMYLPRCIYARLTSLSHSLTLNLLCIHSNKTIAWP